MENNNVLLRLWLLALQMVSAKKQEFTALKLQDNQAFQRKKLILNYIKNQIDHRKRDEENRLGFHEGNGNKSPHRIKSRT